MAVHYTDVDLMLLNRWQEVAAFRDAFDELLGRMTGVIEVAFQRVAGGLAEKGYRSEYDTRRPSFAFWKADWENRKKEAAIYAIVSDFVPEPYGKNIEEHPVLWLMTEDFTSLRTVGTAEDFGRTLRAGLSAEQRARWNHDDFELGRSPVGRDHVDVSESERVAMISDPEKLVAFLRSSIEEVLDLARLVDATLAGMPRK